MVLFFQSQSLVITECACASLIFTSFVDVPSSVCADPKCLKWFTSPMQRFPFILDAVDENFAFFGADLDAVASSSFLQSFSSVISWNSSLPPRRSMLSANRKLQSGRPSSDGHCRH